MLDSVAPPTKAASAVTEPIDDHEASRTEDYGEITALFELPPEAWRVAHRAKRALVRPIERFLKIQAASGLILLAMAIVAMVWANSPWKESYHHLWETPITLGFGAWAFEKSLHFWINDILMVVFFFVVGLEIRREIHNGELSELRRAALPLAAALGGMLVPAGIYWAINFPHPEVHHGWGTPMATDIAFAVGVLALLGKRVPPALRVLLLALAVIDDIGAIVVIAVFYSSGVQVMGLLVAAVAALWILLFQSAGLRSPWMYVPAGVMLWAGMMQAGVHPTIAGVIVGLMTPVRPWLGVDKFVSIAHETVDEFEQKSRTAHDVHELVHALDRLEWARKEAVPPVVRLEAALHPWVAYLIMPLFALANAGVTVDSVDLSAASSMTVLLGVGLGLAVGKPLGITLASWLAVRSGLAALPRGLDYRQVLVVGMVGGVGFTMALFVAGLGFSDAVHLGAAKLAILGGSAVAAIAGLVYGAMVLPKELAPGAARTVVEAEQSTDA